VPTTLVRRLSALEVVEVVGALVVPVLLPLLAAGAGVVPAAAAAVVVPPVVAPPVCVAAAPLLEVELELPPTVTGVPMVLQASIRAAMSASARDWGTSVGSLATAHVRQAWYDVARALVHRQATGSLSHVVFCG
jgi:hypothetical protein